jgi:hypothetical protein
MGWMKTTRRDATRRDATRRARDDARESETTDEDERRRPREDF